MLRAITGNVFNSKYDCIVVPVKCDLVLEGSLGGQAFKKLGTRSLFDISLLKRINYGQATLIYTHGSLPSKAVILVANTWKSRKENPTEARKKTEDYLVKSFLSCINLALDGGFKSIAFPALSTGMYGMTFRICFECFMKAIEEKDADGVTFRNKIDIDFHLANKNIYKNYKDLIDDCCDKHIDLDDFEPLDEKQIRRDRNRASEKWFKDNEYGEVHGTGAKFTQVFANAIQISKKSKSEIYAYVMGKTQFNELCNGKVPPKKEKLVALCLNMELNEDDINEVLLSAGFGKLNPNEDFDKVICECLKDNIYDSDDVNDELRKNKQKEIFKN